jgi:hypothetical protein
MSAELVDAVDALRREIRDAAIAQIAGALYAARIAAGKESELGAEAVNHARQIYREAERP